jgi:hypothetical protein
MQAAYDLSVNPSPGVQPARPSPQSPSGGSSGASYSPRYRPDTYTPSQSTGNYQYSVYNGQLTNVSATSGTGTSAGTASSSVLPTSATSSTASLSPSAGTASSAPLAASAFYGGIPQSIIDGLNAYLAQNQPAAGSSTGTGTTDLGSAIAAAASTGAGDTSWIKDLVNYASTLSPTGGAASSATTATTGAATDTSLTNALNSIQSVIQQDTAQIGGYLATQGYSASQVTSDVNALNYAFTVDALGSVAVGIAADTGKSGTVTVSSSVASIDVSGSSATETVDASTVSFSSRHRGDWAQLESASTSNTATVVDTTASATSGVVADALGTTFSITDHTRHGDIADSTTTVVAIASDTTSSGTSTALVAATSTTDESLTHYHNWHSDTASVAQTNSFVALDWSTPANGSSTGSQASTLYAVQVSSADYATASSVNVYA